MKRSIVLLYGLLAYLSFFVTICYAIGFVGNYSVPKSVDFGGEAGSAGAAVLMNALLLGTFAVQHTIMARPAFKQWWTTIIPKSMERSTYVLVASVILLCTFWLWQPIPIEIWNIQNPVAQWALHISYWLGWGLVFFSSFLINHFDLFGLRQAYLEFRKQPYTQLQFRTTILYKFVRHPLLLGFLIAFWSAPVMTVGHFLFAGLTTAYILVGIEFEERDLEHAHGAAYREYKDRVPKLIPYKGNAVDVMPERQPSKV